MGQKVNPHGLRVGVIKDWDTRWYADKKDFSKFLVEDKRIRDFVKAECFKAGVSRIEIERKGEEKTLVQISAGKPGIIIGRQGAGIEDLKKKLVAKFGRQFFININEIKSVDTEAQLIAENIAKAARGTCFLPPRHETGDGPRHEGGAKGIKTAVSGRLGGAEIARSEHYHDGTIPLQTLRANIEYGFAEAKTTYGRIGVKVWVYKGAIYKTPRKVKVSEGGEA